MVHSHTEGVEDVSFDMLDSLPAPFSTQEDSSLYKVFSSVGESVVNLTEDIDRVQIATQILNSKTIEELEALGKLVNTQYNSGESIEIYRSRILVQFNIITSEGTIDDLLKTTSFILRMRMNDIEYVENISPGVVQLKVPFGALDEGSITGDDLLQLLTDILPAGYTLEIITDSSLEYVEIVTWDEGLFDPEKGKGGLDENGDIVERGTYAGVL